MPYKSPEDLDPNMRAVMPPKAQRMFVNVFNSVFDDTGGDERRAYQAAFAALGRSYKRNAAGEWVSKTAAVLDDLSAKIDGTAGDWSVDVPISKVSQGDEMLAYGWLYVSKDEQGRQVIDHSGEVVYLEDLEKAAQDYMLESREGGDAHQRTDGIARIVESFVVTKDKLAAMGINPDGAREGWWVGFKVLDAGVWSKVKSGEYAMFSIGGTARKVEIDDG